jgi:hypothetical protein
MVQSLNGAGILLTSLLSAMGLNDGVLRTASYTSSLAHIGVARLRPSLVFAAKFQNCLHCLIHLLTFILLNKTCLTVQMGNVDLPQRNEMNYLGIHLDRKLTWKSASNPKENSST